ncbi:MAG TPA: choice-of-anchor D domain-containing protein, partial [Terriglobia bacterium]|nr:choice-of-anchor D domain-containing protein [Terriglobia bacterium]
GSAALSITGIAASGDFAQSNNCGTSLPAGGSCAINVTFAPTSVGARTGALTIADNAAGSPHAVSLTGTGTAPAVNLAPSSLTFSSQTVGTSSAAQTVTLTNTGSAPLNVASITASGDFSQTNNCATSIAAGGSCAINVTFTPAATGSRTGTLTITDNAPDTPQSAGLSGSGTAASTNPAAASLQPASLNFGSVAVGASSPSQPVTLTNTGGSPLAISGIATTDGRFTQLNNCPAQLAAGASCVINVTFTASFAGSANASLVVTDNAPDSLQAVGLTATTATPTVSVSPTSLSLGYQRVGTTSAPRTVILTNTSAVPTAISAITTTGNFGQTNNCGSSLAAYASCTINVTFSPASLFIKTGSLAIADNATGSPQTVSLMGLGTY